ncbi:MAG: HrpB1 family type III secretion system apparatus protein [Deltaproteobacteria bacterium]|nr:HrpB1 family type III secretion system apparatus protein [Deltaproteobacteria bacterium]
MPQDRPGGFRPAFAGISRQTVSDPLLITGDSSVMAAAHQALALAARGGATPLVVDAGMSFDPYRLAALARKHHMPPEALLRAVRVMRVMTALQLVEALLWIARQPPGGMVAVLRPQAVFGDPDLDEGDANHYHRRFIKAIHWFARHGRPLLVAEHSTARRRPFLNHQLHAAIGQHVTATPTQEPLWEKVSFPIPRQ